MEGNLSSYSQENALLFGKLKELSGKMDSILSERKSNLLKIEGLDFELKKEKKARLELQNENIKLKKEVQLLNVKMKNINALEKQNFTIRNKIARIATDIDSQEVSEESWKELIETLIAEIDHCIDQLQS